MRTCTRACGGWVVGGVMGGWEASPKFLVPKKVKTILKKRVGKKESP